MPSNHVYPHNKQCHIVLKVFQNGHLWICIQNVDYKVDRLT